MVDLTPYDTGGLALSAVFDAEPAKTLLCSAMLIIALSAEHLLPVTSCCACWRVAQDGDAQIYLGRGKLLYLCRKHSEEHAVDYVASGVDGSDPTATTAHARAWVERRG